MNCACPTCLARRGHPCVTSTGNPSSKPHAARVAKANPRKAKKKSPIKRRAKKVGKAIEKDAKKAGRKVKKFAGTKTGYTAGGAGIGALALGPLGAIAGAIGGSALHDNPRTDLLAEYKMRIQSYSDGKLKESFEEYDELVSGSKTPVRDFGTEGYPLVMQMLSILRGEMASRGLLVMNPPKRKTSKRKATKRKVGKSKTIPKKAVLKHIDAASADLDVDFLAFHIAARPTRGRRKNPTEVDHERVGMDALRKSEKYHRRYMEHNRLNDLLDTYKWLLIAHEELKYSGKSEPRVQARDGLKAVRRLLLERM